MNFVLDLLKVNEGLNYGLIAAIILSYLFFIWFIVSLWVFVDARKRYKHLATPFLFMILSLFLGLPFLIFYIMARPEHTLEEDYYVNLALSGEKELKPIVFDGEKGFEISLNLSVQPRQTAEGKHTMAMSVEWMPQRLAPIELGKERSKNLGKAAKKFILLPGVWLDKLLKLVSQVKPKKVVKNETNPKSGETKITPPIPMETKGKETKVTSPVLMETNGEETKVTSPIPIETKTEEEKSNIGTVTQLQPQPQPKESFTPTAPALKKKHKKKKRKHH